MESGTAARPPGPSPLVRLRPGKYRSDFGTPSAFKLDEGYSDDTRSVVEQDGAHVAEDMLVLPEWVLAHSEADRAELAYNIMRTLQTSRVAGIVERLRPLLHMDPVLKLPPEITAEIFYYLDRPSLLTASLASRAWRSRTLDSRLWRHLYLSEGWGYDHDAIQSFERRTELAYSHSRLARNGNIDTEMSQSGAQNRLSAAKPGSPRGSQTGSVGNTDLEMVSSSTPGCLNIGHLDLESHTDAEGDHEMIDPTYDDCSTHGSTVHPRSCFSPESSCSGQGREPAAASPSPGPLMSRNWIKPTLLTTSPSGASRLNWAFLYKQRQRLEDNWRKGRFKAFQLPHPSHPYEAHRECVYAIQFSGKWLVSGSRDRTIRVWNLETRRLRGSPLAGHLKSVLCLQFDPSEDEDIIVSGSSDRNVIIWRFSTGQKIHELNNAHQDSVLNLRFDKRYLVTCSKDKLIKVWSRRELRPTGPNYPTMYRGAGVRYPSYIVDTSTVGSLSLETQLANQQIKAVPPYSLLMTLEGHAAAVNAIQIGNDEIVSASGDRLIKVWDIHNGRCMRTLMGHSKGIACVQIDKRRIVSGSNDDTVRIYDHASGAEVACLHGHQDLVRTVQAGFGDLPDADETLRQEAREVDNRYWEAQRRASLENDDDDEDEDADNAAASQDAGANRQSEIRAVGAQIPPGGGGSKWARIVSGSYDETIIIWRRDQEGKWVPAQRLRQEDAARAASAMAVPQAAGSSSRNPDQAQAALAAQISATILPPHPNNQATGTHYGSQIPTATAPAPPATAPNLTLAALPQAAGTQLPPAAAILPTQPLNIPQAPIPANLAPTAQAAPNPQTGPAIPVPGPFPAPPAHHPYRGTHTSHPIARVFKLQFDARKLICASQDSRIVGWDFACADKEIEQACQFFTGF